MVNSVAVERQAISRRGERESSGGGKKERKGRKKERKKGWIVSSGSATREWKRRAREAGGRTRLAALARLAYSRDGSSTVLTVAFPPSPCPSSPSAVVDTALVRPVSVGATPNESESGSCRRGESRAARKLGRRGSPFAIRQGRSQRTKRTRLFPIRENPWAQLSPVGTEREEVREKALSLTGQRNFSIEFFWISCSREGGGCCASSFDTRIDASSRRQQQQQPIAQPTLLNEKQWRVELFSGGRASDRCAAASRSLFQEDVRLNRESGSVGFGLRRCILTDIPKWPWRDFLKL